MFFIDNPEKKNKSNVNLMYLLVYKKHTGNPLHRLQKSATYSFMPRLNRLNSHQYSVVTADIAFISTVVTLLTGVLSL